MFCGALSFQLVIESSYHDYPSNENASIRPIVVTGFRMCLQMWLRKWTDPMITISTPRKLDVVSFASLFSPTNSLYNAMHSMKGNPFFLPHSYQISVLQWQDNHWTDESHFVGNFQREHWNHRQHQTATFNITHLLEYYDGMFAMRLLSSACT